MTTPIRMSVRVEGVVQGVGFRPFVYCLATGLRLAGFVGNDVDGVFIEVEGQPRSVRRFLAELETHGPPLARVDRVTAAEIAPRGAGGFAIAPSAAGGRRRALVSADTATCEDCLAELADPADRRYRYPFINCTNCGPRFTIVKGVPYDRPLTTMAAFAMCGACAAEYRDPANRRFHAQPVCCPECGPRLRLAGRDGADIAGGTSDDVIAEAARRLAAGQVLAVKGLGGYHLAADAASDSAAAALRSRKHREDKPFAIMVAGLAAARALCEVDEAAESALASPARPITLLPALAGALVAGAVAPGNRHLGLMLPYTPLHHLLLESFGKPIILTSGNFSDEPIAYRDDDALARLGAIAEAFLGHDREIHIRADDSVVRPLRGRVTMLRRSRGCAPEPIALGRHIPQPVLACGAELKNTFCLAEGRRAFLSHHIGDLEDFQTLRSFTEGIEHFQRLFGITPALIAHDLHPEHLSSKYALERAEQEGLALAPVQHHHAHIASCLADNGEEGPVIGVAFDGAGYGGDGTLWGGEFLIADLAGFQRAGHLAPAPMPGGSAAIRAPWRMAAAYLDAAFQGERPTGLAVAERNGGWWDQVTEMARRGVNAPLTSSAGRLFDAVAALIGVRDAVTYEGQAAIEMEQLADPGERGGYRAAIVAARGGTAPAEDAGGGGVPLTGAVLARGADLVRAAAEDLLAGVSPPVIAARFHRGVARMVAAVCERLRERSGLSVAALSGGVFQNVLLVEMTAALLEEAGFRVLTHVRVPPNDGGISLGQAVVAGAWAAGDGSWAAGDGAWAGDGATRP